MNLEDMDALTVVWNRETDLVTNHTFEAVKRAQDHAYILGFKRGRECHDDLVAALQRLLDANYKFTEKDAAQARAALAKAQS